MIYFDNAATTYKKPKSVLKEISECLSHYGGNPGRSGHTLSIKASEKVYSVREKIGRLLSYEHPERISFTHNATYALNAAIFGLVRKKCHVLISDIEHNSVLRPIYKLSYELGVEYSIFKSAAQNLTEEIERHLRPDTEFIICTLASNVTGKEIPLKTLFHIKKKHQLKLIVDASQILGHKKLDLGRYPCDALCAPGHKALFGIAGCGFSVYGRNAIPEPIVLGGSGNESRNPFMPEHLPERLEAGTLPTPSIAALGAGIDFINSVGIEEIEKKLTDLTYLTTEMLGDISGIRIYGGNCGTVAFNLYDLPPEDIVACLNDHGILSRGGLHCAPLAHSTLGTLEKGSVRISYSYFNKPKEIEKLYKVLKEIKR